MTSSKPIATAFLVFLVAFLVVMGTMALTDSKKAHEHKRNSLVEFYKKQRASGVLHPFGNAVLKSLLGVSKATATPSKYGIYKGYSPLSSASNQCAAPVVFASSFGLNICYTYVDPYYNTSGSNIMKYNSTAGTYYDYNTTDCTGPYTTGTLQINACDAASDYRAKLFPSSSSPVVSTKPGALFTIYGSQSNCQAANGNGIQGIVYQPTTTNNCFTYDTVANMGNSSSWTCVSSSITQLLYNESSTCYGQIIDGYTFPAAQASCQVNNEGDLATGWVNVGCNN